MLGCLASGTTASALIAVVPGALFPSRLDNDYLCISTEDMCCPLPGGPGGSPGHAGGNPGCRSCPGSRNAASGDWIDELSASGHWSAGAQAEWDATHAGMPVWYLTEPAINLWFYDKPLVYSPSRGPRVAFELYFKNQLGSNGLYDASRPDVFGVGTNWFCSWRSYLQPHPACVTNYLLFGGDGTARCLEPGKVDYNLRQTLEIIGTNLVLSFDSGARWTYGYSNVVGGNTNFFLTRKEDPAGHATRFEYFTTNGAVRLNKVIDVDGAETTFEYKNPAPNSNLITKVSAPFSLAATLAYDASGRLTNIVDAVGLGTSLGYDSTNNIRSLITPYGTNTFTYWGTTNAEWWALRINEMGTRNHFYFYLSNDANARLATNLAAFAPTLAGGLSNTLDTAESQKRNSFYWAQRQIGQLSANFRTNLLNDSFNPDNVTSNDFVRGRQRHWLQVTNPGGYAGNTLSFERDHSPDGTTPGQTTWFDYEGKAGWTNFLEGSQILPRLVCWKLPNGESRYTYSERNSWGKPTNEISTYSLADGSVATRTNTYTLSSDGIDLLTAVGPDGAMDSGYTYNANHQVLIATNAVGELTRYLYDGSNRLTSVTRASGLTATNLYGSDGRLQTTTDIEISRTASYTWASGLVATRTDERGLTVTNQWDSLQRLVSMRYPDNTFSSNVYTRLDLTSRRDRLGNWTYFAYDAFRQLAAETNALTNVTIYTHCTCGSLDFVADALGHSTAFYFDQAGRQVAALFADGFKVTNQFNLLGQLTNRFDSSGLSVTNWFNNQGLMVASSNAFGQMHRTTFDIEDRATNSVDANGVTLITTYDALGRPISRRYPDGGVELFHYSALGLVAHTNQLTNVTRYFYDAAGRKTIETNANLEIIQFKYDASGSITNLIDGKSQNTFWRYDEFGRVTNKADHLGTNVFRYAYDANSRLTNRWTPGTNAAVGLTTGYAYDALGNLTNVDYPNNADLRLTYDVLSRLTNMVDGVGTNRYSYNDAGQLLSEDGPWESDTVNYTYANRLRASLSLQQPNAADWTQSYAFDRALRLTNTASPAGAFGYRYTTAAGTGPGRLIQKLTLPNGAYVTNAFDSVGRLLSTELKSSSHLVLNSHSYQLNPGNQRKQQARTDGSVVDYDYDAAGQLATALGKEPGGITNRWNEQFRYAYDAAGNLSNRVANVLTNVFAVNSLNELTAVVRTNSSLTVGGNYLGVATNVTVADNGNSPVAADRYADGTFARTNVTVLNGTNTFTAVARDADGRADTNTTTAYLPVATSFAYDLNGNMRTNGTRLFDYDDENQLTRITEPGAWKSEFAYDGKMRRRVRREFEWRNSAWVMTNEVRYVYDGNLVLQERDQFNLPVTAYTRGLDLSGSLQGAGGIGGLLALSANSQLPSANSHYYYHADGNGNVTALIDATQTVVARYLYDPYGNTLAASGPAADVNLYRFSSKELHAPSSLVYYLYRHYAPELQRWLNRDPLGESAFILLVRHSSQSRRARPTELLEGSNLYLFAMNAPGNTVDPLGLWSLYKWLYTGDGNTNDDDYDEALDAAADYANCYLDCLKNDNKCAVAWAGSLGGAGIGYGGTPKPLAKLIAGRVFGGSYFKSGVRAVGLRLWDLFGTRSAGSLFLDEAAAFKSAGATGRAARIGVAGAAIAETGFAIHCATKCASQRE